MSSGSGLSTRCGPQAVQAWSLTRGELRDVARVLAGGGTYTQRVWFREQTVLASGQFSILSIHINSTIGTAAEVLYSSTSLQFTLNCFDKNSNFKPSSGSFASDGGWHLIELEAEFVGTTTGQCDLFIDGQRIANATASWAGSALQTALLGELYGSGQWTGVLDFDNYVETAAPVPSMLRWVDERHGPRRHNGKQ